MPRSHGRIAATMWNDADFIAMRGSAQRLYMFLLSQPDLSHAGLLPLRVRRWATKCQDATPKAVREDLDYLADRDFIVTDEDTEEVLVRTFVRNDGVYKQPLVMERMREDAKQIESPLLRWAFAVELERLPLDDLSAEPGKAAGPSVRERVERVVDQLYEDFADTQKPSREGIGKPPERVTDTPHAGAHTSPFPLPPSPIHLDKPLADKSADLARFDEFWDIYGKKVKRADAEKKWAKAIHKVDVDRIISAADAYVTHERLSNEGGRYIADPSTWLYGERWNDERTDLPPPKSNVQEHLSLVQQLAAEEAEQPTLPQIGNAPMSTCIVSLLTRLVTTFRSRANWP